MKKRVQQVKLNAEQVSSWLPKREFTSQKGENGHILVVAGCNQMPGAAFLASLGALKAGAGLVTLASTEWVCRIVASLLPEVTFLYLPEKNGTIDQDAADILLETKSHYQGAVFGPGLSLFLHNFYIYFIFFYAFFCRNDYG